MNSKILKPVTTSSGGVASFLNQVLGTRKFVKEIKIFCPITGQIIDTFSNYKDMLKLWSEMVETKKYTTSCDHVTIVVTYSDGTTFVHLGLDNSARANEHTSPLSNRNNLGDIVGKLLKYYPKKLVISLQEAHRDIFKGPLKNNTRICSFENFVSPTFKDNFANKGVFSPNDNVVDGILIAFGIQVFCTNDIAETLKLSCKMIQGSPLVKIGFSEIIPSHFVYHSPLDFQNLQPKNISDNKGLLALKELIDLLGDSVCVADANLITEITNDAFDIIGNKYLLNPKVLTFLSAFNEMPPTGIETSTIAEHLESFCNEFSLTSENFM